MQHSLTPLFKDLLKVFRRASKGKKRHNENIVFSVMHDVLYPKKLVILEVAYETTEHYLGWVEGAILEAHDLLTQTMDSYPEMSGCTVELRIMHAKSFVSKKIVQQFQLMAAE